LDKGSLSIQLAAIQKELFTSQSCGKPAGRQHIQITSYHSIPLAPKKQIKKEPDIRPKKEERPSLNRHKKPASSIRTFGQRNSRGGSHYSYHFNLVLLREGKGYLMESLLIHQVVENAVDNSSHRGAKAPLRWGQR